MARTVGILLITVGVLDFLVRDHEDSPTLRSVLIANLVLQVGIAPIDPSAYVSGVYGTLGSFVPNTILHVCLAGGFIYFLAKMKKSDNGLTRQRLGSARDLAQVDVSLHPPS